VSESAPDSNSPAPQGFCTGQPASAAVGEVEGRTANSSEVSAKRRQVTTPRKQQGHHQLPAARYRQQISPPQRLGFPQGAVRIRTCRGD